MSLMQQKELVKQNHGTKVGLLFDLFFALVILLATITFIVDVLCATYIIYGLVTNDTALMFNGIKGFVILTVALAIVMPMIFKKATK